MHRKPLTLANNVVAQYDYICFGGISTVGTYIDTCVLINVEFKESKLLQIALGRHHTGEHALPTIRSSANPPISDLRQFMLELFHQAVDAAHPRATLAQHLPSDRQGRAIVIGAGKAAAAMAAELEKHWQGPLSGLVVTRYEHGEACQSIEVIEAAHPVPDQAGREVAERILALVSDLEEQDQVFCLLSGGGSALMSLPARGISFQEKQQINKVLLKSGASIGEMNCVRKHLSQVKGGRLAKACFPATLHTFAISDVPGDDPSVIASGPTCADPSTLEEAMAIISKYQVSVSQEVRDWLHNPNAETVKPGDPCLSRSSYTLIATPQCSLQAAADYAESCGVKTMVLSDCIEGEARDVAMVHGGIVKQITNYQQPMAAPCLLLSGGETSVTVTGSGRGGRNAEFLLALLDWLVANYVHEQVDIYAVAADTDGIDGSETNAGCLLTPNSPQRANKLSLSTKRYLENNDGYGFFSAMGDLLETGPTRTNVNDFRAILVLPKNR